MKTEHNLFTYATKELSQDAFLMWLFNNYNSKNKKVSQAAYMLLNEFTGLNMGVGSVTNLYTPKQIKAKGKNNEKGRMDIVIVFTYKDIHYLIAIEDKTMSGEHDQLGKYNDTLASAETLKRFGVNFSNIYRVFYKTDIRDPFDIEACKNQKPQWVTFFIDDIYPLFQRFYDNNGYVTTGSEILDGYVEHLCDLYVQCTQLPSNLNMKNWNRADYKTFYYLKILNGIETYDSRMTYRNMYETHAHYDAFTFLCRYYFPKTTYSLTFRVDFRLGDIKAYLGFSDCRERSVPFSVDEERAPANIEKAVSDAILSRLSMFSPQNRQAKKYLTVGSSNDEFRNIVNYKESPDHNAEAIKKIMSSFLDACEEIRTLGIV